MDAGFLSCLSGELPLGHRAGGDSNGASSRLMQGAQLRDAARRWCGATVAFVVDLAQIFARSYTEVLLLREGWLGLCFAAGTFLCPQAGVGGLISLTSAWLFGELAGMTRERWQAGGYLANPLLVGLGLGSYLALSWEMALFVSLMGVFAFVATVGLKHVFSTYLRLPVFSAPFVLSMMAGYIASLRYSNLLVEASQPIAWAASPLALPLGVEWFLRSMGAILFVPHPLAGALFAAILAWRSRILFLLALGGFTVGVAVRSVLLGSYPQAVANIGNYNFILVAMVLGGVFLVPSVRSYLVACVGVVAATVLLDFAEVSWSQYGLPAYALPFNVVTLGFLYALGLLGFARTPWIQGETPEETLEIDVALRWRFRESWRALRLPFFGKWDVWQGFDGPWTHHGAWRYAYDFVIADDAGETFQGAGESLADYYCFRRPVASPVRGRVVKVVSELPDNEPGRVASGQGQNWGNVVVIYDERGFYVLLAHFARSSIRVTDGAWVEAGALLGLCGNSGFSPQPHLHVQAQGTPEIGAATLPFSFASYLDGSRFVATALPEVGCRVEPAAADLQMDDRLEFLLGDELSYEVTHEGRPVGRLDLRVAVAVDGTLYFESRSGGRLYFGRRNGTFYFYRAAGADPYLSLLLRAMPSVPLAYRESLEWTDHLPASVVLSGGDRAAVQLVSSLAPSLERLDCRLRFEGPDGVRTETTGNLLGIREEAFVSFDAAKGPSHVRLGGWKLARVPSKKEVPLQSSSN